MNPYAIRTHDLSKEYNGEAILKKINLQLERGRIHAIIGPSGVGKSVLLRLLNLLEEPTSGEIHFDGRALKENDRLELQRRMTLVFQKPVLFNTSVYENVAYGLKVRKENRRSILEKVRKALEVVDLKNYEHKRARNLSGGEKQRVAIAQAMVLEPEILFLDEPTSDILTPVPSLNSKLVSSTFAILIPSGAINLVIVALACILAIVASITSYLSS
ncbi:hypothetical protein LCGC14_2751780 [marine sediment metagenome]|uniref:ABC transporter domain-containing protein n=1 Tax=marine sediment metagenome TaxID=412755 RepID=A0A0F8ZNK5_9ZZZZ